MLSSSSLSCACVFEYTYPQAEEAHRKALRFFTWLHHNEVIASCCRGRLFSDLGHNGRCPSKMIIRQTHMHTSPVRPVPAGQTHALLLSHHTHMDAGRKLWGARLSLSAIEHKRQEREICQVRQR